MSTAPDASGCEVFIGEFKSGNPSLLYKKEERVAAQLGSRFASSFSKEQTFLRSPKL
jgi:hypothetical protein